MYMYLSAHEQEHLPISRYRRGKGREAWAWGLWIQSSTIAYDADGQNVCCFVVEPENSFSTAMCNIILKEKNHIGSNERNPPGIFWLLFRMCFTFITTEQTEKCSWRICLVLAAPRVPCKVHGHHDHPVLAWSNILMNELYERQEFYSMQHVTTRN